MNRQTRVCLITNDPAQKGGAGGYFRAVFEVLRSRSDLEMEILSLPPAGDHRLDLEPWAYAFGGNPGTRAGEFEGTPVLYSGGARRLEPLAFRAARTNWLPRIQAADAVIAVSGAALVGWPLTGSGVRYLFFTATSLDDERKHAQRGWARDLLYQINRPWLRDMERQVYQKASLIFTLTPAMHRIISAESGVPPARFRVFPMPVDAGRYSPAPEAFQPGTILWMARHEDPRKNTALLLQAAARLAAFFPGLRLVLAGSPLPDRLLKLSRSLGLTERIEAPGWVDEDRKIELLRQADVFVIPSDQEGLCIAGLEAMACGVPVVSTRCVGPEVFVKDGVNGFLVGRGDADGLADKIKLLLGDRACRERMGGAARKIVEDEFSPSAAASALGSALAEVWPERFAPGSEA